MPPEIIQPGGQTDTVPSAKPLSPPTPAPESERTDPSPDQPNPAPPPQPAKPQPARPLFAPDQPSAKPPKKRFRLSRPRWLTKKVVLILAVVVIVLLGGSGFAYVKIMNNKPEKILADALRNTMTDILDRKPLDSVGKLTFESKEEHSKYKVSVDFKAKQANNNFEGSATLKFQTSSVDVSVTGNVIAIGGDEAYIKFENVAQTLQQAAKSFPAYEPYVAVYDPLVKKIDNKWIKIDAESVADLGIGRSKDQADACGKAFNELRVSKNDGKKIKKIFSKNQFAIATETLPKQGVGGENSYHYKLDLNTSAASQFYKEMVELPSFAKVKKECDLKADQFTQEQKDTELQKAETKPVYELWVGSKTRRPTKFKVTMDNKEVTMDLSTTVKIDAANVHIEKPTDFITTKDLQKEFDDIFGAQIDDPGSQSDTGANARNTERQTDIKALHGQIEAYYAQNGYYPTLANLNDGAWRATNMKGLDDEALKDPKGAGATLVAAPAANVYSYAVTASDGASCDNVSDDCAQYTLTATYEGGGTFAKSNLN